MVHCLIHVWFIARHFYFYSIRLYISWHLYGSVYAGACAWVLVCYARPFRQLKVKYYSVFGKVLNYIYSFVYANKAI